MWILITRRKIAMEIKNFLKGTAVAASFAIAGTLISAPSALAAFLTNGSSFTINSTVRVADGTEAVPSLSGSLLFGGPFGGPFAPAPAAAGAISLANAGEFTVALPTGSFAGSLAATNGGDPTSHRIFSQSIGILPTPADPIPLLQFNLVPPVGGATNPITFEIESPLTIITSGQFVDVTANGFFRSANTLETLGLGTASFSFPTAILPGSETSFQGAFIVTKQVPEPATVAGTVLVAGFLVKRRRKKKLVGTSV